MQLIDQHKDVLDKAKSDYEKLKKTVDELRASEVLLCWSSFCLLVFNLSILHGDVSNWGAG